ncbi:hypothetical protein NHU_01654 [Rhodovulum sulfidophilum]|uniref:Uncharacterized protein n=1 Tax=Rhodovulum sulfidophilum TaxID=35806 RepID=A0A0D6B1D2_RHOSU|nr:hypothetical protein NHU_01654 [Rhodovulum sulfidophilum]
MVDGAGRPYQTLSEGGCASVGACGNAHHRLDRAARQANGAPCASLRRICLSGDRAQIAWPDPGADSSGVERMVYTHRQRGFDSLSAHHPKINHLNLNVKSRLWTTREAAWSTLPAEGVDSSYGIFARG